MTLNEIATLSERCSNLDGGDQRARNGRESASAVSAACYCRARQDRGVSQQELRSCATNAGLSRTGN